MKSLVVCIVAAAAVLAAPVAAAQTFNVADLTASSLQATGLDEVMGVARALVYRSFDRDSQAQFTMQLTAQHLHIETDHAQILAEPNGIEIDGTLWTDAADHDATKAVLDSARPHFKVEVLALDGRPLSAGLTSSCLGWTLPATSTLEASKFAQSPRPRPSVSTQGTVQITPCVGAATVTGDFLLVLWETTLHVDSPSGPTVYHSGYATAPARSPDGTSTPASTRQADQIYVTATGAELHLQRTAASDGAVAAFFGEAAARIQGTLEAGGAKGRLLVADRIQDLPTNVQLQGDLRLTTGRFGEGILTHVDARQGALQFNGDRLVLASTTTLLPQSSTVWVALVGAAAVLGAAGGLCWNRLRSHRGLRDPWPFRLANAFLEADRPRLALAAAALKIFRTADTYALRARIHLEGGSHRKAVACAAKADAQLTDPFHKGANCIVGCLAAARLKDANDAGTWFARAVTADPAFWWYLDNDEPLSSISGDAAFQARLSQVDPAGLLAP